VRPIFQQNPLSPSRAAHFASCRGAQDGEIKQSVSKCAAKRRARPCRHATAVAGRGPPSDIEPVASLPEMPALQKYLRYKKRSPW